MAVTVVGAGLAGSEAAWQLAERGIAVTLVEMRPHKSTPAHHTAYFAELVCSNSLRSDELTNAVGLLKEEMRRLGSLIMRCADETRLPAGGALASTARRFPARHGRVAAHPRITVVYEEMTDIPGDVIFATGPLTSDALTEKFAALIGDKGFSAYDAAAPIVTFESIDMEKAFFASRYGKGSADYINCPMTREEYTAFATLIAAEERPCTGLRTKPSSRVHARRGHGAAQEDTLRYGRSSPSASLTPRQGGSRTPSCSFGRITSPARCTTSWVSRRISNSASKSACFR